MEISDTLRESGLDLAACDREPIHIPESIQPHGVLVCVSEPELHIHAVSANAADMFDREPSTLLTLPLAKLFDAQSMMDIAGLTGLDFGDLPTPVDLRLANAPAVTWRTYVHKGPTGLLLEAEFAQSGFGPIDIMLSTNTAMLHLRAAIDVDGVCRSLSEEVQRLTGYDRVKVYRFSEDWHGEVIAETNVSDLPCYLGLHFPASDIPEQARALYARNLERQIPDIHYVAVPLLNPGREPADLSGAMLRSVSPIHIEYLSAMGVGASMSLSIMRDTGDMWGLVACHHHEPRHVPAEVRHACVLLAQIAGYKIITLQQAETIKRQIDLKGIESALLQTGLDNRDYNAAILGHSPSFTDLLDASGFALFYRDTISTIGQVPDIGNLKDLTGWLTRNCNPLVVTDNLVSVYPPAEGWKESVGMLAVRLSPFGADMMVWFRPEVALSVTWAGDPSKPVTLLDSGPRLSPRLSFSSWIEKVAGRSTPWQPYQIVAANHLRDVAVNLLLYRSAALERINYQITQSNIELTAFSHVASHDLKEPLRQLETLTHFIHDTTDRCGACSAEVGEWIYGIQKGSRRLRQLIDDLAKYARVGQHKKTFIEASLETILQNVKDDLRTLVADTKATIKSEPLPSLPCDALQMHQVFQNIIQNAIKYRHPDRLPVIAISATKCDIGSSYLPDATSAVVVTIADNGIGIDKTYFEVIFDPFHRLHSNDEYEGSGIGLSICKKIVALHQGTLSVASELGRGSTFTIVLPIRAAKAQTASA